MIKKKDMTQHLEWRLRCIRKRIEQLKPSGNERVLAKLNWELTVTLEILSVIKESV